MNRNTRHCEKRQRRGNPRTPRVIGCRAALAVTALWGSTATVHGKRSVVIHDIQLHGLPRPVDLAMTGWWCFGNFQLPEPRFGSAYPVVGWRGGCRSRHPAVAKLAFDVVAQDPTRRNTARETHGVTITSIGFASSFSRSTDFFPL